MYVVYLGSVGIISIITLSSFLTTFSISLLVIILFSSQLFCYFFFLVFCCEPFKTYFSLSHSHVSIVLNSQNLLCHASFDYLASSLALAVPGYS